MTKVFHGTTTAKALSLLQPSGQLLYVTDTAERAQLYADAQATGTVSTTVRKANGSAVVEMETDEDIEWRRRAADHNTLDVCETTIRTWTVSNVTVYMRAYDVEHSVMKVSDSEHPLGYSYRKTIEVLQEAFGDKLTVIVNK
jgi:transposase